MTANYLVWAAAAVFLIFMVIGFTQGFVRFIFALFSAILTAVLVIMLVNPMAEWLKNHTPVYTSIESVCKEKLTADIPDGTTVLQQSSFIEKVPVPQTLKDKLTANNNSTVYEKLGVTDFSDYISAYTAGIILKVLAFIAAFLLITLLLRLTIFTLDRIAELPVLHGINKFLGLLCGAGMGLLVIWVFFLVLTLFWSTKFGQDCSAQIDQSRFLTFLYDKNILLKYISKVY